MNRTLAITAGALLTAGALSSTALALSSGDTSAHKITVSHARIVNFDGPQTVYATARLSFPSSWKTVRTPASRVSLREGDANCAYSVVSTTAVGIGTTTDASAEARTLAPAAGRYVLEEGTRGSSAWRVTRIKQPGVIVTLHAVGVSPLSALSKQLTLAAGRRAFLVTTVDAHSGAKDECHSGTYRDVVGPSIGDALATARVRAYIDVVAKR